MTIRELILKEFTCPNCNELLNNTNKCNLCGWKRTRVTISKDVQQEVWHRDMGKCVECNSEVSLGYDHIIPFRKGASDTAENIQLLCYRCYRIRLYRCYDFVVFNKCWKFHKNINFKELIKKSRTCPNCNELLNNKNKCNLCGWEKNFETISKNVRQEVRYRDNGKCVECDSEENVGYDHIIPFKIGASDTVENIQLLCYRCHRIRFSRCFNYEDFNRKFL